MEGLGVWAGSTQVMKCLFMVMSLNPAPLISTADFTCLADGNRLVAGLLLAICLNDGNPNEH